MTTTAIKGQRIFVVHNDVKHYGTVLRSSNAVKGTTQIQWDSESYLPDGDYATGLLEKRGLDAARLSEPA